MGLPWGCRGLAVELIDVRAPRLNWPRHRSTNYRVCEPYLALGLQYIAPVAQIYCLPGRPIALGYAVGYMTLLDLQIA